MKWRRGRYTAVIALVGAILVCALGAAPASAGTPPTASFTFPTPDVTGGAITFDASGTVDPNGGTITNYSLGLRRRHRDRHHRSATVAHTYTAPETNAI